MTMNSVGAARALRCARSIWALAVAAGASSTAFAYPGMSAQSVAQHSATSTGAVHYTPGHGLQLPMDLRLNGHFDLNYERTGYSDQPFRAGQDRLVNYHRFLFLTRESRKDPFGFTAEVLNLTFYELKYRYRPADGPWRFGLRAGKILVPFGPDPLYHRSYGGRTGFDQELLPIIWAQYGLRWEAQYRRRDVALSADLYGIRGFSLPDQDAVLNLQSDYSDPNAMRYGVGLRLGASWQYLRLWYSAYANKLGFGRTLFMQALDASIWKPPYDIARYFSLNAGIFRADVSGGGAGKDYYHFGSYVELRGYPTPWLYIVGRTGLKTENNRRDFYIDNARLGPEDRVTYALGAVARYHSVRFALLHQWVLEKRDEQANDLLRLTVSYAF